MDVIVNDGSLETMAWSRDVPRWYFHCLTSHLGLDDYHLVLVSVLTVTFLVLILVLLLLYWVLVSQD